MCQNSEDVKWYMKTATDLFEVSPLEDQFQNLLVYPFLERIVSGKDDIKVIDCHNFRQFNTNAHTRCDYSVLVKAVPDLLIARNFVYHNRDNNKNDKENTKCKSMEIIAAVEVKAPNSNCMTKKKEKAGGDNEYKNSLYLELFPSLYKNKKIIFTNICQWDFYDWEQVQDSKLKSRLDKYMEILEFCGFDNGADYVTINRKREIKAEILDKKWEKFNALKEEGSLDFLDKNLKEMDKSEINKQNLEEIVKSADRIYIDDIKKCIKEAKTDFSTHVITNNFECDELKIKELYDHLKSFFGIIT